MQNYTLKIWYMIGIWPKKPHEIVSPCPAQKTHYRGLDLNLRYDFLTSPEINVL